jgi:hypothetical protein
MSIEHTGDGCRTREHAHGSLHLGKITAGNDSRRLEIDTNFEPSRTPVNELNCSFCLDRRNGRVDVLWDDIAAIQHAASHVFTCE